MTEVRDEELGNGPYIPSVNRFYNPTMTEKNVEVFTQIKLFFRYGYGTFQ